MNESLKKYKYFESLISDLIEDNEYFQLDSETDGEENNTNTKTATVQKGNNIKQKSD